MRAFADAGITFVPGAPPVTPAPDAKAMAAHAEKTRSDNGARNGASHGEKPELTHRA
jgi:hypothetical protein